MSIDATKWAWTQRDVTPSEKLILLSYADRAGETHEAWPSWNRLIEDTGLDRKTIYYSLLSLQKKGKIIKTGEKKKRVYVYRLIGVEGREQQSYPHSSNNGTIRNKSNSSNNGTSISSNNGTINSSNNGTRKPKRNLQEKPKGKFLSFSSFSDPSLFDNYVKELVISTGKKPVDDLLYEVLWYAENNKSKLDKGDSVGKAINCIRNGTWRTPHGCKGITSKTIREKEEKNERIKQEQHHKDALISRNIHKIVLSGQGIEALRTMKNLVGTNAHQGRMPTPIVQDRN